MSCGGVVFFNDLFYLIQNDKLVFDVLIGLTVLVREPVFTK
jgi:hypothetical protein